MARNRKNRLLESVQVDSIAANGLGMARVDGKVIFVEKTIPGDLVDVKLTKNKKDYGQGFPLSFRQRSPHRQESFCSHFGTCGGCVWQDVDYNTQLSFKHKVVEDAFRRIGKQYDLPEIKPVLPAPFQQYYRNKLEYTFSSDRWITKEEMEEGTEITQRNALGFHIPGRFDKILDIEHCYLQASPSNEIRLAVRAYAITHGLSFYNLREHTGYLRNLMIRTSTTGDLMVVLVVAEDNEAQTEKLMRHLCTVFPEITSAWYACNTKLNDSMYDLDMVHFKGEEFIMETIEGISYRLGPKSFFQTNSFQTVNLYSKAIELAGLQPDDVVYDLYTGIGSIALQAAGSCKKVVGVESVPDAVTDAERNASLNGIDNCTVICGDMAKVFDETFIEQHGKADVVVTDPPRAGMHKDVCAMLLQLEPRVIVYVSCNPVTQARDMQLLAEKYAVTHITPVDMFPHTHHIENVIRLERRSLQ